MASAVCEHCMAPVAFGETLVCQEGFSYHKKCKKCYVCSETNLHNAEIFQGVIFCAACAKRIFQGCSTARRTKATPRKRRTRRDRRGKDKGPDDTRVIERARLARSRHSSAQETSSNHEVPDLSVKPEPQGVGADPVRLDVSPCYCVVDIAQKATDIMKFFAFQRQLKQKSDDHGMNTDVSNVLLNDLSYLIDIDCDPRDKVSTLEELHNIKQKRLKKKKTKHPCSDLRIAELGASTEIASMTLRKKSNVTNKKSFSEKVTNSTSLAATQFSSKLRSGTFNTSDTGASHSGIRARQTHSTTTPTRTTHSESLVANETGSEHSAVEWVDSVCNKYRELSEANRSMFKRHLGSIITLPFKLFKKNIMMRSSLVSVILSHETHKLTFSDRIKTLFYEEIPEHRERGIKRLYSTINKRRKPYKLGWLKYQDRPKKTLRPKYECTHLKHRCKHFHASHSYRCMRAQVMRLAGPTKSEMRRFRRKLRKSVVLPWWRQNKKFSPPGVICATCACADSVVHCASRDIRTSFSVEDWQGIIKSKLTNVTLQFNFVDFNCHQRIGAMCLESFRPSEVDLSGNRLTTLSEIPTLPIQNLTVSNSEVETIEYGCFRHLRESLVILDLSRNQLTTSALDSRVFAGLPNGTEVPNFNKLKYVSLARNDLHSLPKDLFVHMPAVTHLDLGGNPLAYFDSVTQSALSDLTMLRNLTINACDLESLPEGLFRRLRKLQYLDLSENRFTTVPARISEAVSLLYLKLDKNPIETIEDNTPFSTLTKLKDLSIRRLSKLKTIGAGALGGLESLVILHLSHNPRLTTIDPKFLTWEDEDEVVRTPMLKEFYLNNNNISDVSAYFLNSWHVLEAADFSNNPFMCSCEHQWMVDVLVPQLTNLGGDGLAHMTCQGPKPVRGMTLSQLQNLSKPLMCMERMQASPPQTDSAIMFGMMIGVFATFPMVILVVLLWKKGIFTKCRKKSNVQHEFEEDMF